MSSLGCSLEPFTPPLGRGIVARYTLRYVRNHYVTHVTL